MRWLVVVAQTYYPLVQVFEAATADGALEEAKAEHVYPYEEGAVAVIPLHEVALWAGDEAIVNAVKDGTW